MRPIALAMGGLLATLAHAQDNSWEQIRKGVLAHPGLEHARKMLEERKSEGQWAGRLPAPRVELELENFAGSGGASGIGGSNFGLWAGSDYRLGDVREREKELAAAEVAIQALDTLRARRELLVAARGVWDRWRQERWRAGLLDSLGSQADALADQLEKGRKVGRIAPWEVSVARAESARWRMNAQAHRHNATVQWRRLAAWGAGVEEPGWAPAPAIDSTNIVGNPALDSMVLEAERTRARVQAALLQAQDLPVVSGAVGVLRDQSNGDVGLGVRVSLPLGPWKRTGIEAARARHQAAALERSIGLAVRERENRRIGLQGEWMAALAGLRSWESQVIPARESGLNLVEVSHAAGAVDASAVWAVRKELWEARIERLERSIRVQEIQRELEILEGTEP